MIYDEFLKSPKICSLLGELKDRSIIDNNKQISEYESESLAGDDNAYTFQVPIEIFNDCLNIRDNINKIFTINNMLTVSLLNYMETEVQNITQTFGNFIDILPIETVEEMLKLTLELNSKDFRASMFKIWMMVDDKNYHNRNFIKVLKSLPLQDIKIFLINFSSVRYKVGYENELIKIYQNYYPQFFSDFCENHTVIEELLNKNNKDYNGLTPFYLTLYVGWRENNPTKQFKEFINYLTSFNYEYSIEFFRFLDDDYYNVFKKFINDDELTAGVYFQLFDYMIKKYGSEYYEYYHYDPYDSCNSSVTINFDDFKRHYIKNAPIDWVAELCTFKTVNFDDSAQMFYQVK